jgi:hypothetical protein
LFHLPDTSIADGFLINKRSYRTYLRTFAALDARRFPHGIVAIETDLFIMAAAHHIDNTIDNDMVAGLDTPTA